MADEGELIALLAAWRRAQAEGSPLTLAELCAGRPELLAEIERQVAAVDRKTPPDGAFPTLTVLPAQAEAAARGAPRAHPLPEKVGNFKVLKLLGRGGMGAVYLCEDMRLGRRAAVKVMLPDVADIADCRQRFLREGRAAARVEHDYIVPIWEIGEDVCGPFIAMPFLQGEMLDDRISRGASVPIALVLKVARETSEALAAAHQAGLIHRDVKPANIWLEGDPSAATLEAQVRRCKILDFGLAMVADGTEVRLTATGAVMGTPAYMSPEQAQGQPADPRSDLFSLGVVLFEMTVGTLPFGGQNLMGILYSLATVHPPLVHTKNPQAPHSLSDLINRLLAKDAAQRPQSAREVAAAAARIERELHLDPSSSSIGGFGTLPVTPSTISAAAGPGSARVPDFGAWGRPASTDAISAPLAATAESPASRTGASSSSSSAAGSSPPPPSPEPAPEPPPRRRGLAGTFFFLSLVAAGAALIASNGGRFPWNSEPSGPAPPLAATDDVTALPISPLQVEWGGEASQSGGGGFFNGQDLAGWSGSKEHFAAADGVLTGTPRKAPAGDVFLFTNRAYADFELSFRARPAEGKGGGGLLFRARTILGEEGAERVVAGPCCELGEPDWGGLVDRRLAFRTLLQAPEKAAAAAVQVKPADFHDVKIRCVDQRVQIFIDGAAAVDGVFDLPAEGVVGWRVGSDAAGPLQIRAVKFTDLGRSRPAAWQPPSSGRSPLDRLEARSIPPEERFSGQPPELVATIGSRAGRTWGDVSCAAAAPAKSGGWGALGLRSGAIEVWSAEPRKLQWTVPNSGSDAAPVTALRFDSSGKRLFVARGQTERRIECLDLSGGEPRPAGPTSSEKQLVGIEHPVLQIELCDQDRTLILSDRKIFSVYDLSGSKHRRWQPPRESRGVVFATGAGAAVHLDAAGRLQRSEIHDGRLGEPVPLAIELQGEGAGPRALSADGGRLAVWNAGALQTWDLSGAAPKRIESTPASPRDGVVPTAVYAFSSDGRWLASSAAEIRLFKVEAGALRPQAAFFSDPDAPLAAAFSSDGGRAVWAATGGAVRFADLAGESPREILPPEASSSFSGRQAPFCRFGPFADGGLMLRPVDFAEGKARFQLWDLKGARPESTVEAVSLPMRGLDAALPTPLALGQWTSSGVGMDMSQLFRLVDGKWGATAPRFNRDGPLAGTSPDGTLLVTFSKTDGRWTHLRGWDCQGEPLPRWSVPLPPDAGPTERVFPIRWFSPDGRWFATFTAPPGARDEAAAQLVVWRNADPQPIAMISMPIRLDGAESGRAACFADGLLYRVAPDGETIVEEVTGPAPVEVAGSRDAVGVRGLALHPGGRFLARAHDGGVDVLDSAALDRVWSWKAPGPVEAAAFAPDGRHLVLHNGDRTVYVLRLALPEPAPVGRWRLIGDDWVDLVPLLGPNAEAKRDDGLLFPARGKTNQLVLPVACDGGYDLRMEVSFEEGPDGCWIYLPVGSRNVAFALNVHREHGGFVGLDRIGGVRLLDNGTRIPMAPLAPGRKIGVKISVRLSGPRAEIVAEVEKVKRLRWEGPLSDLSYPLDVWDRPRWFGVGAWRTNYRLHSANFKRAGGTAKQLIPPAPVEP